MAANNNSNNNNHNNPSNNINKPDITPTGSNKINTICSYCWNKSNFHCSKCKQVHYCCVECQKKHWCVHKILCKRSSQPMNIQHNCQFIQSFITRDINVALLFLFTYLNIFSAIALSGSCWFWRKFLTEAKRVINFLNEKDISAFKAHSQGLVSVGAYIQYPPLARLHNVQTPHFIRLSHIPWIRPYVHKIELDDNTISQPLAIFNNLSLFCRLEALQISVTRYGSLVRCLDYSSFQFVSPSFAVTDGNHIEIQQYLPKPRTSDFHSNIANCFVSLGKTLRYLNLYVEGGESQYIVPYILDKIHLLQSVRELSITQKDKPESFEQHSLYFAGLSNLPNLVSFKISLLPPRDNVFIAWYASYEQILSLCLCKNLVYLNCGSWCPLRYYSFAYNSDPFRYTRKIVRSQFEEFIEEFDIDSQPEDTDAVNEGISVLLKHIPSKPVVNDNDNNNNNNNNNTNDNNSNTHINTAPNLQLNLRSTVMSKLVWKHVRKMVWLKSLTPFVWSDNLEQTDWEYLKQFKELLEFGFYRMWNDIIKNNTYPVSSFLDPLTTGCTKLYTLELSGIKLSCTHLLQICEKLPCLREFSLLTVHIASALTPLTRAERLRGLKLMDCVVDEKDEIKYDNIVFMESPLNALRLNIRVLLPELPLLRMLTIIDCHQGRLTAQAATALNQILYSKLPCIDRKSFEEAQNLLP